MMQFNGDDVIVLLKQKVADLSLEVEMYRQYVRQLEARLSSTDGENAVKSTEADADEANTE